MMILFKCIHCNKKLLQICKMILQYIDLLLPLQFSREKISYAFYLESFVLKAILNSYLKYLQVDQSLHYMEVEPFRHILCLVTKVLLGCLLLQVTSDLHCGNEKRSFQDKGLSWSLLKRLQNLFRRSQRQQDRNRSRNAHGCQQNIWGAVSASQSANIQNEYQIHVIF